MGIINALNTFKSVGRSVFKSLDGLVTICLAVWLVRRFVFFYGLLCGYAKLIFQCRESGDLVGFSVSQVRRIGCYVLRVWQESSFSVRELGELAVLLFASQASRQFCSLRVRRAGSFAVRELGELAVLQFAS